jgi:hypothetical protein
MQILFGAAVAIGYAVFMELNLVFGLFYSLTLVSIFRGMFIVAREKIAEQYDKAWDGSIDER